MIKNHVHFTRPKTALCKPVCGSEIPVPPIPTPPRSSDSISSQSQKNRYMDLVEEAIAPILSNNGVQIQDKPCFISHQTSQQACIAYQTSVISNNSTADGEGVLIISSYGNIPKWDSLTKPKKKMSIQDYDGVTIPKWDNRIPPTEGVHLPFQNEVNILNIDDEDGKNNVEKSMSDDACEPAEESGLVDTSRSQESNVPMWRKALHNRTVLRETSPEKFHETCINTGPTWSQLQSTVKARSPNGRTSVQMPIATIKTQRSSGKKVLRVQTGSPRPLGGKAFTRAEKALRIGSAFESRNLCVGNINTGGIKAYGNPVGKFYQNSTQGIVNCNNKTDKYKPVISRPFSAWGENIDVSRMTPQSTMDRHVSGVVPEDIGKDPKHLAAKDSKEHDSHYVYHYVTKHAHRAIYQADISSKPSYDFPPENTAETISPKSSGVPENHSVHHADGEMYSPDLYPGPCSDLPAYSDTKKQLTYSTSISNKEESHLQGESLCRENHYQTSQSYFTGNLQDSSVRDAEGLDDENGRDLTSTEILEVCKSVSVESPPPGSLRYCGEFLGQVFETPDHSGDEEYNDKGKKEEGKKAISAPEDIRISIKSKIISKKELDYGDKERNKHTEEKQRDDEERFTALEHYLNITPCGGPKMVRKPKPRKNVHSPQTTALLQQQQAWLEASMGSSTTDKLQPDKLVKKTKKRVAHQVGLPKDRSALLRHKHRPKSCYGLEKQIDENQLQIQGNASRQQSRNSTDSGVIQYRSDWTQETFHDYVKAPSDTVDEPEEITMHRTSSEIMKQLHKQDASFWLQKHQNDDNPDGLNYSKTSIHHRCY